MWLLDTRTPGLVLKNIPEHDLEPCPNGEPPKIRYGILSHRWGPDEEELTFDEVRSLNSHRGGLCCHCRNRCAVVPASSTPRRDELGSSTYSAPMPAEDYSMEESPIYGKQGARKVELFRQIARDEYQLDYVWADTCKCMMMLDDYVPKVNQNRYHDTGCIDKRSSTELQEAINSMYRWYQRAAICLAYLVDVTEDEIKAQFGQSEWFERGWTLQELLAPTTLHFYNKTWQYLGDKNYRAEQIAEITGINRDVLRHKRNVEDYSVAQRMSWAARRITSRIEDRAYSLLGIFNISIPLLYGEGTKAFQRLQKEILKTIDDTSLFAWDSLDRSDTGLLAPQPDAFVGSRMIERGSHHMFGNDKSRPYTVSCHGITGIFYMIPYTVDIYIALLFHWDLGLSRGGIFLQHLRYADLYVRVLIQGRGMTFFQMGCLDDERGYERPLPRREITVTRDANTMFPPLPRTIQGFMIEDFRREKLWRLETFTDYDRATGIFSLPAGSGKIHTIGCITFGNRMRLFEAMLFGFTSSYFPAIYLMSAEVTYHDKWNSLSRTYSLIFENRHTGDAAVIEDTLESHELFYGSDDDVCWDDVLPGLWIIRCHRLSSKHEIEIRSRALSEQSTTASSILRLLHRRIGFESTYVWKLQVID